MVFVFCIRVYTCVYLVSLGRDFGSFFRRCVEYLGGLAVLEEG